MKIPISWLTELVEINTDINVLCEKLSNAGFEIEGIEDQSEKLENVVIGKIKSIESHPNADKLKVCSVDVGKSQPKQIICGAKNVEKDAHVLVAEEGASLKDNQLVIKETKLRGVLSQGMICSYEEIGIEDSSDGIAILEESKNIQIGQKASKYLSLDDIILDIAITANRPDGMSIIGIAREISILTDKRLKDLGRKEVRTSFNLESDKIIENINTESEKYTIHRINNLTNKKSPEVIKKRLIKSEIKPINLIVDLTNYLMVEQGQPMHAFDGDKLNKICGRNVEEKDFGIRKGRKGEEFKALDNIVYKLSPKNKIITCNDIPIAIAGIIGGKDSSVDMSSTNIWLEVAVFSPKEVRISSRDLGKRTESSSRFEKGISLYGIDESVYRFNYLLNDILGSEIENSYYTKIQSDLDNKTILLRKKRIDSVLGKIRDSSIVTNNHTSKSDRVNKNAYRYISNDEVENILKKLNCKVQRKDNNWIVNSPKNRLTDLHREIDLIEEIARLIGYDKFSSNIPSPIKPGKLTKIQKAERLIRNRLTSAGMQEVSTLTLVSEIKGNDTQVRISNPLLSDTSHLRTNLWREHLNICKRNIKYGQKSCWIYEIGNVHIVNKDKYKENKILGGMITGSKRMEMWSSKEVHHDYFKARGILQKLFNSLKLTTIDKQIEDESRLHPGRGCELMIHGKKIGLFGELHPRLSEEYQLDQKLYVFEIDINLLLIAATRDSIWSPRFKEFPIVPTIERDIAFITSKNYSSSMIIDKIKKAGKPILESVELIDIYENDKIGNDCRSLAYRIIYRDKIKTLRESEVEPIHAKVRRMLEMTFKADLRS